MTMACSCSGPCAMTIDAVLRRRHRAFFALLLALAVPGLQASPSQSFVIGVDPSAAGTLNAWIEAAEGESAERFDEQIFTDISPLIESEDAVRLPSETPEKAPEVSVN